jgi:glycosyltransferase involved in cell wall biosynthesis
VINQRKKIAILIDWYLPGTRAGGPVRSIYSLVTLLKNEFDLYVITTNSDLGSSEEYTGINPDTLFEKNGVHYFYFSAGHLTEANVLNQISIIQPHLLYLNSFWSYHFSIAIVRAKNKGLLNTPLLLAPRGMLGKGALSLKAGKKIMFLALAKLFRWYEQTSFHATNEQEKSDILKRFKKAKILTAPNVNAGTVLEVSKNKETGSIKLFYLSRIARVKNLHFALELLSTLPNELQVEYDIYGNKEDREYVAQCEKIIQQLPKNIRVIFKGELAFHEVQHTIASYHALLLPTLNENFGHSIVESLLCGCPVVISDQTPWNDLELHNAGYAVPLDEKQKFTVALTSLARLNNNDFQTKSKAAIKYISDKLNIARSVEQYKHLFNDSIKN